MADNPQGPTADVWWQQLLKGAAAALVPIAIKAVMDAFTALEKKLAPWDGSTERRAPPPPPAGGTP
jgi:hypothetical protein